VSSDVISGNDRKRRPHGDDLRTRNPAGPLGGTPNPEPTAVARPTRPKPEPRNRAPEPAPSPLRVRLPAAAHRRFKPVHHARGHLRAGGPRRHRNAPLHYLYYVLSHRYPKHHVSRPKVRQRPICPVRVRLSTARPLLSRMVRSGRSANAVLMLAQHNRCRCGLANVCPAPLASIFARGAPAAAPLVLSLGSAVSAISRADSGGPFCADGRVHRVWPSRGL